MKRIFVLITAAFITLPLFWSCTEEQETPKVQSISIVQEDMTLEEGESVNLTATILPEEATDKTVAWSSSNDEIVMISSNGKAKAMSIGEAMITAKAGDKSDFITITVVAKTIPVTGLSLNPSSITLKVGESQTITADVTPQNATDKNVTWESSNPEVASVNNGTVTGLNPGSVTITAKTVNGGKTAECSVTVKANLAPSVTIGADHISAVSAVLFGEANLETSGSSDLTMGFMLSTSSGVLPSNSTKIEARQIEAKEGFEASYSYNVGALGLEPETTYYYRSYITQSGQDAYGETKSFTTKEFSSLLTTQEATDVTATSATLNGTTDLSDVSAACKTIEYGFYWGTSESEQSTKLSSSNVAGNAFSASLNNLYHKTQYWYKSYLKLNNQLVFGQVNPFTTGVVPVESVSLDRTEYVSYTIGSTLTLTATILPTDATDQSVEWSSSDANVATVDQSGTVITIDHGTATIMVRTIDQDKTATCTIIVAQYVADIGLNKTSLDLAEGETQTLIATVSPATAYNKTLTWTSSNDSVASVDGNGLVKAMSKGKAVITASANDGCGITTTCDVIVSSPCPDGAVDLGFRTPDGFRLYWATSNLSTNGLCPNPQDYGDYYAWGETEPYYLEGHSRDNKCTSWRSRSNPPITGYNWESYKWCKGSCDRLTRYCQSSWSDYYWGGSGSPDNKKEFKDYDYADDAARQKLGGKWHTPTYSEWNELVNNCTFTWTDNYNNTGICGQIATSNKTGYTDKSIFLPAAVCRHLDYRFDSLNDFVGLYWSSTLSANPTEARSFTFMSGGVFWDITMQRVLGLSIRPVTD